MRVQKVDTNPQGVKDLFRGYKKEQLTVVFDATRCWQYYAQLIEPYANKLVVAHPLKTRAIASARIKTDSIDSNILADFPRANLIPESYLPPTEFIELREQLRYRAMFSKNRARYKIQLRYILSCEGKQCEWNDIAAKQARLWLNNVELTDQHRQQVDYLLRLIDDLAKEISTLDREFEKIAIQYPEVDLLKSIPGTSTFSGLLIIAEIVDVMRFPTAHKLAAYAGLVPSTYQSSNSCYHGKITK